MAYKETLSLLELANPPIVGLFFTDGDKYIPAFFKGEKLPFISFPSGFVTNLFETSEVDILGYVCLFEQIDIPLVGTRDEVYEEFLPTCVEHGYVIRKLDNDKIEFDCTYEPDEHFIVTYNPQTGRIDDVEQIIANERW